MSTISSLMQKLPTATQAAGIIESTIPTIATNSVLALIGANACGIKASAFGVVLQQLAASCLHQPVNQFINHADKLIPQRVKEFIPDSVSNSPFPKSTASVVGFVAPYLIGEQIANLAGSNAPFYLPVVGTIVLGGATVAGAAILARLSHSLNLESQISQMRQPSVAPDATPEAPTQAINVNDSPLNANNFAPIVLQAKGVALVLASAGKMDTDEAMYAAYKQIRKLSASEKHFTVGYLDISENEALAKEYNIGTQPSVLVFKDGQLISTHVINPPKPLILA